MARYDDGHAHCFGCGYYEKADGSVVEDKPKAKKVTDLMEGDYQALVKRGITEETCRKFSYMVGKDKHGKPVQIANYFNGNQRAAQKIRWANKDFKFIGDTKSVGFFGQQLWTKGSKLVITEGEIDCLSVSQMQNNKWPVVSISNGAQGAKKSISSQLDYLANFDQIILMFDMDEPGQAAAIECAELLPPGKAFIAHLPEKDPNELLQQGRGEEIIRAIWNAKPYRPDGIKAGADMLEEILNQEQVQRVPYPFEGMNEKTGGMGRSELITVTAGSGIGKSSFIREIAYHLGVTLGEKVGLLMLEESTKRTALGLMGLSIDKPLHINYGDADRAELEAAFRNTLGTGNFYLYDHFGSTDLDNLLNRVRYMAKSVGCGWVILDHLSIVVSGLGESDERKLIDEIMTKLRTLVQELNIGLIVVSHLKRPEGNKGHEEGASVSLSQLRGSHAIAQLSDIVWGLERDQQASNPNITTIKCLKNRFSGLTGLAGYLDYSPETGRLRFSRDAAGIGFGSVDKGEEF